ncbi:MULTISPECIES: sensor histidine kinase [Mesonia]|uniref:Alkaline phosphatase synthesis sensor protein PhoR n=1 Tax=Mesonia oceanica TaxID=2687242 RepID=A0AC61Y588_9FLAO|nr:MULTISPECIES: ATP-binding protein [Mesonia]MAN29014.1 two-component sensor histidine kinase [Mesonia sp.]MAQ42796.1 two-component sensor histidine kinase [Mesonia sp.]MBJ99334.1 two-component sensor histidine kinase [Flavobacteriaceae bacterium]VVU99666.1 Alkaline phosphatase synthesis sensor protein PhoR [Mesonia oceanica]|tara:strand:+ start:20129 stop:21208 length:1080 start_codon:yes stop_codon:yes gene_type:complete
MAKEFKRSYKFAFYTSLFITLFTTGALAAYQVFYANFSFIHTAVFFVLCYCLAFLIIQLRIEHFIYRRVKAVYDNVSLLESSSLQKQQVTTDMATLTREVEKFAEGKKLEIEALKIRENYRKEFMGNVSHELKTPLFTVQGYILTLIDGAIKDKKVRDKYLNRASKGLDRLIYIVKDLDMITKLEAGELHLREEEFDIIEVIQNVFDLFEMKSAKKNISLTFDLDYEEPIYIYADKEKIQQVITNLVVNSIKYGKIGGTTEVSIEDLIKNKVIVRITDNGEGIEQKNIPRLFERFYRVDKSGSRKEGGSGLGLAIVKHILEAHNEKIYVESDFGVGSEFSFTLEKSKQRAPVQTSTAKT